MALARNIAIASTMAMVGMGVTVLGMFGAGGAIVMSQAASSFSIVFGMIPAAIGTAWTCMEVKHCCIDGCGTEVHNAEYEEAAVLLDDDMQSPVAYYGGLDIERGVRGASSEEDEYRSNSDATKWQKRVSVTDSNQDQVISIVS